MRLGLCAELKRLWIRLVIKTVLPERLKPVTASQTVAPPAISPRLSRSDAWAKIGGSQLKFTKEDILNPMAPPRTLARDRQHREVGLKSGFRKWIRKVDGAARPIVRPPPCSTVAIGPYLMITRALALAHRPSCRVWSIKDNSGAANRAPRRTRR